MPSHSVLVTLLNRLGGRTDGAAASRDLVPLAPGHLPLVEVRDDPETGVRVTALNVGELMARCEGDAAVAMDLLATIVRDGTTRGADGAFWAARDRKDVARQALQWALDRPDQGLEPEAFAIARMALGA